jgi:peptidyl-prolyl cis-trans isomerase SurA
MKRIVVFILFAIFSTSIFAQSEEILLTIGKNKITSDEFKYIFKKNNSINSDENVVNSYLDLFINFKLKVVEAENLKMDTSASFKNELSGYREQLAKPYLSESLEMEEFLKEQYDRSLKDVKLDLIFISVPPDTEDGSKIWTEALDKSNKIKARLMKGEDFEKVAQEVSDDKAVASNKGHLPYLPILRMPYSIQNSVISLKLKEFSEPVKTTFGYYIIRKIEERPSPGSIKVAHIMVRMPEGISEKEMKVAKGKIDSIYNKLLAGQDFNELAVLSDDKGTSKKGGELPWFSTGRMVPEFEDAAFNLKKIDSYTKPIQTPIGWHIIKLLDRKAPENFENQKEEIRSKIEKDDEIQSIVKETVTNKLKMLYSFKEVNAPERFYTLVDSSIFEGKWKFTGIIQESENFNKLLFKINGLKYDENDFGIYIETAQKRGKSRPIKDVVDAMYKNYIYESLVDVEKDGLETKHPEFKYLLQEYHDGILLFDINKLNIWDKASDDSLGLQKFYKQNIEDYNKEIKLNISVFKYSDIKYEEKAEKLLTKQRDKYSDELLVSEIAANDVSKFSLINSGSYSKNENIYGDKIFALIKENKISESQQFVNIPEDNIIVYINERIKSQGKPFSQIKGIIIADYQDYLDKIWIAELKNKYPVKINKKVLENIKF